MSIKSMMPSNHLILCHPSLLLPSVFPRIRVFSNKSALHIRWPKYWSFSFSIGSSNEYSGLISFRMDWDSQESSPIPQLESINSSALSLLYGPALTSIHDYWKNHSFDYMEAVTDFIFLGSKITADDVFHHEIKRHLLLGRKAMTNLDSILKAETLLCQKSSIQSRLWFFQWSCMDVRVGLWRKLSAKELMLLNCGVGEDSWESLGLQGDPTSPS